VRAADISRMRKESTGFGFYLARAAYDSQQNVSAVSLLYSLTSKRLLSESCDKQRRFP